MADTFSAFFYGTLLHPKILRRVIGHDGANLEICPALLLEHTRHQIKHADYPGVLPYSISRELFIANGNGRELEPEERTVRGTLVTGLSAKDIELLDIFEGDEYVRESVSVHPLGPFTRLALSVEDSSVAPLIPPPLPALSSLDQPISAHTYIWAQPISALRPQLWDYADFVRDNAWKWVGSGAQDNEDYIEVDRRRDMGGNIVRTGVVSESDGDATEAKNERIVIEAV